MQATFVNQMICGVMFAKSVSPIWLDAFHRAYHQYEMDKCFSVDKKIIARSPAGEERKKYVKFPKYYTARP